MFRTSCWLILFLATVGYIYPSLAQNIKIAKITIGEDVIDPGRKQLIEVLLKNYSAINRSLVVKLVITLPNQLIITFGEKHVLAKAKSDTRALLVYPVDKRKSGDYRVTARIFDTRGHEIAASTEAQNKHFFAGNPAQQKTLTVEKHKAEVKKQQEKIIKQETVRSSGIHFDPPDLLFEQIGFSNNNSILRGETAHVKIVILNDGGDLAENVTYSLYWFYEYRPKKKNPFFNDTIKIIAAGERKIVDVPLTIPSTELKGKYFVEAVIDEPNYIKESNENNNTLIGTEPLIFADIALEFPENSHSFAEDGRFIFQWRSKAYNQFKIQISTDEQFQNLDLTFEIPKGDKWETSHMIRPLVGEMPAMAVSLMENTGATFLFWRVKAKNSQGETAESAPRKFYITLKPDSSKQDQEDLNQ